MDVNKAFRFVFDDKQWVSKVGTAVLMSVLSFLILPALILQGYIVRIIRQVMDGRRDDLPEWQDMGELLKDGFFVTLAQIIWTLPFILLFVVGGIATGALGSLADGGSDLATAGAVGGGLLLACLGILFVVALLFLTPAILIQYAITDDFGATFRFSEVWAIARDNLADILLAFLVTLAAGFVLSVAIGLASATIILIPVAILVAIAMGGYISFVSAHLYGQIGAKVLGSKSGNYLPKDPGLA